MTTKEEILNLAKECGLQTGYLSQEQAAEAFYHAARKDLEQEVERLKEEVRVTKEEDFPRKVKAVANNWKNKLASAQLQIKQYRDAFELQRRDKWHWEEIRDKALALPADTSALETMIQKAGEVMRERCIAEAAKPRAPMALNVGYTIRALPPVTLEDLK